MRKFFNICVCLFTWFNALSVYAADKFEILPDLPEPLQAAQASSVSSTDSSNLITAQQSIGQEPNLIQVVFSLIFVIVLIYAVNAIYTKLNAFNEKTLKNKIGDVSDSKVSVVSTTPLGSNKTLHVVELDGKRMLIGASANSIHLIKDLGSCSTTDIEEGNYSKIEIPNIRIPKIEIPKIEFPNIGFTKTTHKQKENKDNYFEEKKENISTEKQNNEFEISEIYEEGPDGIIDKLFHTNSDDSSLSDIEEKTTTEIHQVNPEEFLLYKKYL